MIVSVLKYSFFRDTIVKNLETIFETIGEENPFKVSLVG